MIPIRRVVALLLALQIVSTGYLWVGNILGTLSEGTFAMFLAANLLSFSIVAYVYTHDKWGENIARGWMLAGSLGLTLLLLSSLYFH
jgi:hypothetical protein